MQIRSGTPKSFSRLKTSKNWSFEKYGKAETTKLSHSYHRYPAKFIPQLVDKLLNTYTAPGDKVCDPFGGCGTTLVESKVQGRQSIGFDINPVAKLITDTKTHAISPVLLEAVFKKFQTDIERASVLRKKRQHNSRIHYWFEKETIQELDQIYAAILSIKNNDARRFFLCAFSHVLKNCSRWLMKSIKPTVDKDKSIPKPKAVFTKHLNKMLQKNKALYTVLKDSGRLRVSSEMRLWDSTRPFPVKSNTLDLVITSPPYVTSYEYADLHQLSLLWFGEDKKHFKSWDKFVSNFKGFRSGFVGSSFKSKTTRDYGSSIAWEIVFDLSMKDWSFANGVANYFSDMKKVFTEMHRVLKPGKKACIIIGNTELLGVPILNAEVAVQQMENIGFKQVKVVKRAVTSKLITPWRDTHTGKFTSKSNRSKKRAYEYEFILLMEK